MDRYFKNCSTVKEVGDLHITGVTCMFMASKYEDIYPLKMKNSFWKNRSLKVRNWNDKTSRARHCQNRKLQNTCSNCSRFPKGLPGRCSRYSYSKQVWDQKERRSSLGLQRSSPIRRRSLCSRGPMWSTKALRLPYRKDGYISCKDGDAWSRA